MVVNPRPGHSHYIRVLPNLLPELGNRAVHLQLVLKAYFTSIPRLTKAISKSRL
jgi:hypothetical protein